MERRRISLQEVNPVRKQEHGPVSNGVKAVVVSCDMVTPYGWGADACWNGIMSGQTAISTLDRFNTRSFQSDYAATVNNLKYLHGDSLAMQMFRSLFDRISVSIPKNARLMLATIKGEIDLLEKYYLQGTGDVSSCNLNNLLDKVSAITGVEDRGIVISAACASSTAAVARAAAMINGGHCDCVLVAACDCVTEFLFSGFSSLMALDKFGARPFDRNRNGLSLGEAAAFALIMSESRARREKREIIGQIMGWGLSDDADHMTRPSSDSAGRALAIKKALKIAGIDRSEIGLISAHGTGTVYNDSMEIKAFRAIFNDGTPVYSIKGAIGHTMGAAGLVEMIIALKALKEQKIPPTINLKDCDEDAKGWVSSEYRDAEKNRMALITSAGFGGINAALILS
jgi:3-oxoacyl-[acyl-carrier-protein] synthase II